MSQSSWWPVVSSGEIPGHPSQESEPTVSTQTSPLQSQDEETEMTDESKINVPDEIMTQQNSIPQVATGKSLTYYLKSWRCSSLLARANFNYSDAKVVVVPAERVHKSKI